MALPRWKVEVRVGGQTWVFTDGPQPAAHPWTAIMRLLRGLWRDNDAAIRTASSFTIYVERARKGD